MYITVQQIDDGVMLTNLCSTLFDMVKEYFKCSGTEITNNSNDPTCLWCSVLSGRKKNVKKTLENPHLIKKKNFSTSNKP